MASNICKILFSRIGINHKTFFHYIPSFSMLYSLELQMAGIILFTAMIAGGISLWIKRRKLEKESIEKESLRQDMSEDI